MQLGSRQVNNLFKKILLLKGWLSGYYCDVWYVLSGSL